MSETADTGKPLEERPGILVIGSPGVGKRTIISRLLSLDIEDASDSSSSELLVHGWTINTKYYVADVSVWMAHLHGELSVAALPFYSNLAALVMVFDMSNLASLTSLQTWVSQTDIHKFDILLCIGNKADLVPGYSAHVEYRRCLQRLSNSADLNLDDKEYGLSETDGRSLLGDEELPWEHKRSCLEWCSERHIEYIEACASNADFDKCLSSEDDAQGLERISGALSAHLWPGMILKSGQKLVEPSLSETQVSSEEESDYEVEYEVLSSGSVDQWNNADEGWVSAYGPVELEGGRRPDLQATSTEGCNHDDTAKCEEENLQASASVVHKATEIELTPKVHGAADTGALPDESVGLEFEDLDQLMSEIGNMRNSIRLMPDFQRRDMAAKLAMKMATMFGDDSGEEDGSF